MQEIQLTELLPEIVTELSRRADAKSQIRLCIPNDLPSILWPDSGLKDLITSFARQAAVLNNPDQPIRIAVCKRNRLADIEGLLVIRPAYWIQLKMDMGALFLLESCVRENLKETGFRYEDEWTMEDEGLRLLSYSYGNQPNPALLLCIQSRRAGHTYTLLLPVSESGNRC